MQYTIAGIPGLGFELQRRFRASPERLFKAWTQPAALREWWCPAGWSAGEIDIDLRVGGVYRIEMTRSGSVDASIAVSGQFIEVRPPDRLVYTWQWEGAFPDLPETVVTLELQGSSDGMTLLTLRHEGFNKSSVRQQHRSGWMSACDRLNRKVMSPAPSPKRSAPL